jgi:hypothetical protein
MVRQLERRISRLEGAQNVAPPVGLPKLIVCQLGESAEEAILRVCGGEAGLPAGSTETGPHLIVIPVAPPDRGSNGRCCP